MCLTARKSGRRVSGSDRSRSYASALLNVELITTSSLERIAMQYKIGLYADARR